MEWRNIKWKSIEFYIFKLQKKIYEASKKKNEFEMTRLQKILLSSNAAKLKAFLPLWQQDRVELVFKMIDAGIEDKDLLIVDRSLEPGNNKIAICFIDGDFTVKRIQIKKDGVYLMPENKEYKPIKINEENELIIWGIVTYVIKSF